MPTEYTRVKSNDSFTDLFSAVIYKQKKKNIVKEIVVEWIFIIIST